MKGAGLPSSCGSACVAQLPRSVALLRAMSLAAVLAMLTGCMVSPFASLTDRTRQIWEGPGAPPVSLPAPTGFKVTPSQAYQIVTGGVMRKWGLYIYADPSYYYLVEHAPLLIPTSGYARAHGKQVDGTTGECSKCPKRTAPPLGAQ